MKKVNKVHIGFSCLSAFLIICLYFTWLVIDIYFREKNINIGCFQYLWVYIFWLPLAIYLLYSARKYSKLEYNTSIYEKISLCSICVICVALMFFYADFKSCTHDPSIVTNVENQINFKMPKHFKITTLNTYQQTFEGEKNSVIYSYVKFSDTDEINRFENSIKNSNLWSTEFADYRELRNKVDLLMQRNSDEYYYLIYIVETDEYNKNPDTIINSDIVFLEYNMTEHYLDIFQYSIDEKYFSDEMDFIK